MLSIKPSIDGSPPLLSFIPFCCHLYHHGPKKLTSSIEELPIKKHETKLEGCPPQREA
jgi:hypothetical protein